MIRTLAVTIGPRAAPGDLRVPPDARGVVLFAHGSGSSRHSPRNRQVAQALERHALGTLLFDLLDEREAADRRNVFDIDLLARRVLDAVAWARREPALAALPLGLFGASTGAAAALRAAAARPADIQAVVSRGGRPDLAIAALPQVEAPTLLILGGDDTVLLEPHQQALAALRCTKHLEIVPGASHLFEEPGTLERVAQLACDWFERFLPAGAPPRA